MSQPGENETTRIMREDEPTRMSEDEPTRIMRDETTRIMREDEPGK